MFRKSVGDRLTRFRQIDIDKIHRHHDALEFSNGTIVFLTDLTTGQRAVVLQLPISPMEKPVALHSSAEQEEVWT